MTDDSTSAPETAVRRWKLLVVLCMLEFRGHGQHQGSFHQLHIVAAASS